MDQLAPINSNPKRRRRFTAQFKQQVIDACEVPGQSVASVARQYDLNANLLHKWRRTRHNNVQTDFVQLPIPAMPNASPQTANGATVRIELARGVIAYWPISAMDQSVSWLKAMASE